MPAAKAFLNIGADGPHTPAFTRSAAFLAREEELSSASASKKRVGTDAGVEGGGIRAMFPCHTICTDQTSRASESHQPRSADRRPARWVIALRW